MLHPDFRDLLSVLAEERVEYLVIGGYAVGFHSRPRTTKDIDLWVRDDATNLARLRAALLKFGTPEGVVEALDRGTPDDIVWFGIPPTRVDILRRIPGPLFDEAYGRRVVAAWDGAPVSLIGADDLIVAKRASGREQDLRDIKAIERARSRRS